SSGEEVAGYGFLVVPPLDEMRLTLNPTAPKLSVHEDESVEADLRTLIDLGAGDQIVVDDAAPTVQRAQASCTVAGGTTIRYSAGREAPWTDACTVRV